jgi:DNA-binding CsgD family transcriptional regulator
MSNQSVATELHFSPKTVEYYLGRISRKLDIATRGELPGIVVRLGNSWSEVTALRTSLAG